MALASLPASGCCFGGLMRSMTLRALAISTTVLIAACGGSYQGAGTSGGGVTPGTATPAIVGLLASSTQLSSSADTQTAGITLTALVRDNSSNVMAGVPVTFSITPAGNAGIIVTRSTTDAGGTAQAVVTTGGDPTNRTFTVSATAGSAVGSVSINVVGTTARVNGPAATQFRTPTAYTAVVTDSSGRGIANKAITITSVAGNTITANTFTTDANGQVAFTYNAATAATTDTVTATALGVSGSLVITISQDNFAFSAPAAGANVNLSTAQAVTVNWTRGASAVNGATVTLASTRGQFHNAADCLVGSLVGSSASGTTAAGAVTFYICSTDAGTANMSANGNDGAGSTPTASRNFDFVATTPASVALQSSPAKISTNSTSQITAIVRDATGNLVKGTTVDFTLQDATNGTLSAPSSVTDGQGLARVIYSSSSTTSSSNGVRVTGTVSGTALTATTLLTVGGQGARIALGTGNQILIASSTLYQLPYTVIVTDNAGTPIAGAVVTLSAVPLYYQKGTLAYNAATNSIVTNYSIASPGCPNEDVNLNGFIDGNEDANLNGVLDPGNPATVPSSVTVGSDGTATFNVTYFKDRNYWIYLQLSASTTVSGDQANAVQKFILPIAEPDLKNPAGGTSPYGIANSCANKN